MLKVQADITINRPIEEVFAFISDNENDPQWCIPVMTTDRIVGDAPGAGTRYKFSSKAGFFTVHGEFNIIEFDPPKRITWQLQSSVNHTNGEYRLEEVEGGTHLTEVMELEPRWFLKILQSSMQGQVQSAISGQLKRLKRLLEADNLS